MKALYWSLSFNWNTSYISIIGNMTWKSFDFQLNEIGYRLQQVKKEFIRCANIRLKDILLL